MWKHQSERNMTEYKIHISSILEVNNNDNWYLLTKGLTSVSFKSFSLLANDVHNKNPKTSTVPPAKYQTCTCFTVNSHVSVYLVAWHGFQLTTLAGDTGSMVEHDRKRGWIPWDLPPCYGALALFQPVKKRWESVGTAIWKRKFEVEK